MLQLIFVVQIDFATLDRLLLRPVGMYGSKSSLVNFLRDIDAIDDSTYASKFYGPA